MAQGKPSFSIINKLQTIFDLRKVMRWKRKLKFDIKCYILKNAPLVFTETTYNGKQTRLEEFIIKYLTVYLVNINFLFFYFKFNYEVNPLSPPRIFIYQVLLLFKQSFVIQECSTFLFNRAGSWILHFSCTFQTWNDLFPWKKSKYITILSTVHLLCLVKSRTQHIKISCYFFHKKWHWFPLIKKVFIIVSLFLDLLQVKHINVPSLQFLQYFSYRE